MVTTSEKAAPAAAIPAGSKPARRTSSYRAYQVLRIAFAVAPIVAGVDKFLGLLTDWTRYLAPAIPDLLHLSSTSVMRMAGMVEVFAGLLVASKPRFGAPLVMFWLWGIIGNLLLLGAYYDVALRDLGLSLGALALAYLARDYDRPPAA